MRPTFTITKDLTKQVNDIVRKFRHDDILVGIPASDAEREGNETVNNPTLLAICNFGSAANNIPPWPVMAIGIRNAQDAIAEQFKVAAIAALKKGFSALQPAYERIGIIASNSIKKVINSQEDVPEGKPAESTLAARRLRRFKGTKYWLVSGQMRNAITYVVRGAA
jgi:hypothetical protein